MDEQQNEPIEYVLNFHQPKLDYVLNRDGFVIFISGAKESGKTNISLLLAEYCYQKAYRYKIATNIKTESYMVQKQITDLETLENWLQEPERKLYILDELGKHMKKRRPLAEMNVLLMDIIQLIRHYDSGFIGIAPTEDLIDSLFSNTDILDLHIHKLNKKMAICKDVLQKSTYFLVSVPETSIKYNSKDIAIFKRSKTQEFEHLPLCCQVAKRYAETNLMSVVQREFNTSRSQIKRLLKGHIRHTVQCTPVLYTDAV